MRGSVNRRRLGLLAVVLVLVVAACGGDDASGDTTVSTVAPVTTATTPSATTEAPATTAAPATTEAPATTTSAAAGDVDYVASEVSITVDGDPSDWDGVPAFDLSLVPIDGEEDAVEAKDGFVKVAYDDENVYVLFSVEDDFDWVEGDAHNSGAIGVAWAVDSGAGPAMGATEEDQETSLGLVDIWHWELDCAAGVESGGAIYESGEGKAGGNDSGCNFDDEYSTTPDDREDDDQAGAENSLFGVYSHTSAVNGEDGIWYFEMSRPLNTGDAMDAPFVAGGTGMLALAYWDADQGPDGWDDDEHVQSTEDGWIIVGFGG